MFPEGVETQRIACFEHTELVFLLITFAKAFVDGIPVTP